MIFMVSLKFLITTAYLQLHRLFVKIHVFDKSNKNITLISKPLLSKNIQIQKQQSMF